MIPRVLLVAQSALLLTLCILAPAAAQAPQPPSAFTQVDCQRLGASAGEVCAGAARGELAALLELGRMLAAGRNVERDDTLAVRALRLAANQGNAQARNALGEMIKDGRGTERNAEAATELFRRAAEQGLADAQLNLALQYQSGAGVGQDYFEAARWLERAAEQGNLRAVVALGQAFEYGLGKPLDLGRAAALYRQAAEQGSAEGQFQLASLHQDGRGVPLNLAEASRLFQLAVAQNHAAAQNALGVLNRDGLGMARDEAAATRLFRAAAERGLAAAQFNLAQLLEQQHALQEALRWYREAYRGGQSDGIPQAQAAIDRLVDIALRGLGTSLSAGAASQTPSAQVADGVDQRCREAAFVQSCPLTCRASCANITLFNRAQNACLRAMGSGVVDEARCVTSPPQAPR